MGVSCTSAKLRTLFATFLLLTLVACGKGSGDRPGTLDGGGIGDALLGDVGAADVYPPTPSLPSLLLLGPEGGFIPFERELIMKAGARPVSLGPRTLRVETALHCAVGRHLAGKVE